MKIDKDMRQDIEKIANFCNKIGLVHPAGSIYGGLSGFWDLGPTGVEVSSRIKEAWWADFIRKQPNIVGIDGSIITHPDVWKASGHVDGFTDPLVLCEGKCKKNFRADQIIEDQLGQSADGLGLDQLNDLIQSNNLRCPECKGVLSEPKVFNLMFKTQVGPVEPSIEAYLRPETAQSIFAAFKSVTDATRLKLPFGVAQIGKVFRNEISPRNFLFRVREFELMEFEFFVDPEAKDVCTAPDFDQFQSFSLNIFHRGHQEMANAPDYDTMTLAQALEEGYFLNAWQAYWLTKFVAWFHKFNIDPSHLRLRQHVLTELSHYAEDTWDIEYHYPFGWKELLGCANRATFDLTQHSEFSKAKLEYHDQVAKRKFIPYVAAEPSVGVGRIFLTLLFEHYKEETVKGRKRVVLGIPARLAPVDVAVLPLQNKDELSTIAQDLTTQLREEGLIVNHDTSGNIGKRYRRMDEVGTPVCVTVDFDTVVDKTVTLRDRDTMKQIRIPLGEVCGFVVRNKRSSAFGDYPEVDTSG